MRGPAWLPLAIPLARIRTSSPKSRSREAEAEKPKPKSRSRESRSRESQPHAARRDRFGAGCAGAAPATVAGGTAGAATGDAAAGPAAATAAKRRTVASLGIHAASLRTNCSKAAGCVPSAFWRLSSRFTKVKAPVAGFHSGRFFRGVHNNLGVPRLETRPRPLQVFRQRGSAKPKHFQ